MATLLVYGRVFDHPFLGYDDDEYVSNNPHVQQGLTFSGIRWALTSFACSNWHPLTWLSLQLDDELHGLRPGGYHATNLLLHVANTILLFLVLDRFTGRVWRSALVAALFALHPLHVESVAWIAERKDLLSTLFWMLTLAAYGGYVRRPGVGRYVLVVLAFALGLMAKPMLVTLPCVLLLLDYWPLGRVGRVAWRRLVGEKVPLFALVAVSCMLTLAAQQKAVASFEAFSLPVRIGNAALAYVGYLGKTFWPLHLAVFYPHPGATLSVAGAVAAGALLVMVTALVLGPGRRWSYLAVGWLWFLGTLVPVIGLVQTGAQASADRYSYVPLVGVFVLLIWGVSDWLTARQVPRWVPLATAAAVVVACAALTWMQLGFWDSDLALWEHTLAVTENNAVAHSNYGTACYRNGMPSRAREHFERAVTIDERNARAHYNLGTVLWEEGRAGEAAVQLQRAVELDPGDGRYSYYLGQVLAVLGQPREAEAAYRWSIACDPGRPQAHRFLGLILQADGRLAEAVAEYGQAIALGDDLATPLRRRCERYLLLRERLPAVVRGEERLADGEALEFALLCQEPFERRYAQAVQCFTTAFNARPALADSVQPHYRYLAARAAAQAGCGRDSAPLDEPEKPRLRGQALTWLQADLARASKVLTAPSQKSQQAESLRRLRLWRQDPALEGVRSPAALANLPEPEREAWQRLWRDWKTLVETSAGRTVEATAPPISSPPSPPADAAPPRGSSSRNPAG